MLKLNFKGEIAEVIKGTEQISKTMHFELSDDGIGVVVSKCEKGFVVFGDKNGAEISYNEKRDFFRALGYLCAKIKEGKDFDISETPNFEMLCLHVDCSRNAVLTVESIKRMLDYCAVMGYNAFTIYSEDMITLPSYPYFGHMRGRYSVEELKECDDYAYEYGIEIIPQAQSLGHMSVALKWYGCDIPKDTSAILLVGDEGTYKFLDELIGTWSKALRSRKIHLHMDEAVGLGTGTYKKLHGHKEPVDIAIEHMNRVNKITEKYGYEKSYIAHDMFTREFSKTGNFYDTNVEIPEEIKTRIPLNYTIDYWDYHQKDKSIYENMIDILSQFPNELLYAGGILTWGRIVPNYALTFECMPLALKTCLEKGIKSVEACIWGDDGNETNTFAGLLGMQLFAEYSYTGTNEVSMEKIKERFFECTGGNMDDFIEMAKLDCITKELSTDMPHTDETPLSATNTAKFSLYGDPLIGLMDKHIEEWPVNEYYSNLAPRLKAAKERAGELEFLFDMPYKLSKVLSLKADLGVEITRAYKNGDKKELKRICDEVIPKIKVLVEETRKAHREQWMSTYKPFGWEVLDCRYGGVLTRLDSTAYRIEKYLNGEIKNIAELEEERLYYDGMNRPKNHPVGGVNGYKQMVTAGNIVM